MEQRVLSDDICNPAFELTPISAVTLERLDGKVPLVVGVTGHVGLDARSHPELEKAVEAFFLELKQRYPATPLLVLSSLAEGADRIVARVALRPEIGALLQAVLPMPQSEFEADFPEPQSREEFHRLLSAAHAGIRVVGALESERDRRYLRCGAFIAKHCQILLAIWDGEKSRGPGGTADIVQYKLEGSPEEMRDSIGPVDPLELGPVYHIEGIRAQQASRDWTQSPRRRWLYPYIYEAQKAVNPGTFYHEHVFEPIDRFNAENIDSEQLESSLLVPEAVLDECSDIESGNLLYVHRLFARADARAIQLRKLTRRALYAFSVLVGISAVCLETANGLLGEPELVLVRFSTAFFYPFLLMLALAAYTRVKRARLQDRFQDYRALAEGLRVQFFWCLCGIRESVASQYLGKLRIELFWIRHACVSARLLVSRCGPSLNRERTEIVLRYWVRDQLAYFQRRGGAQRKLAGKLHRMVELLFWSGALIASFVSCLGILGHLHLYPRPALPLIEWIISPETEGFDVLFFVSIIATVIAALIGNFAEKTSPEENARQFARMEHLFADAEREIQRELNAEQLSHVTRCIFDLGDASLEENGDWLVRHRERPVDVPHH